jgi:hypothetical protein
VTTFRDDPAAPSRVVLTRTQRLRRLSDAVSAYVGTEKARIDAEVASLQAILDGRALYKRALPAVSKAAANDLEEYLADSAASLQAIDQAAPKEPASVPKPVFTPVAFGATGDSVVQEIPADPTNYGGRAGSKVDTIVVHVTQGTTRSAALWFANPAAKVSAHYIIGKNGAMVNCVPESLCAWHADNRGYNRRSIGIECEGFVDDPTMWTDALMSTLTKLCNDLSTRYNIPVSRSTIIGHNEVPGASHTDPGPLMPWERLLDGLSAMRGAT